ncbi:MAG: response regulator [Eubacteriales bacterium]|nr:response regulator [Eubacteriales bacterium]
MINLLIVEDDPMVAELNRRYVSTIDGYHVIGIARNGEEAMSKLESYEIDLLLLDMYMPKTNGLELLKDIRSNKMMVDVIMVTAAKETDSIDELFKLGVVDYLIKPFEYERLKNSLENYKSRFQLLNTKKEITQEDIDRITISPGQEFSTSLQKGLHKNTLERIRVYMQSRQNQQVTSNELADSLQVSAVTIRRYLEYLVSIGEVRLEIEYGSIGRPSYLYRYKE